MFISTMKCNAKNLVFLAALLLLSLPVRAGFVVEPQMLDFGEGLEASAHAFSARYCSACSFLLT